MELARQHSPHYKKASTWQISSRRSSASAPTRRLKTAVRATRDAITAGDKEKATASLALAGKKLDKAASKGVIHKNQAANRKSAIAKQVAAL